MGNALALTGVIVMIAAFIGLIEALDRV